MAKQVLLTFLVVLRCAEAAVDLTLTNKATGSDVIEAVVDLIQQSCIFPDDRLLLRRIAAVETDDGQNARTFVRNGADFYGGIWQVDERVFATTKRSASAAVYNQIKIRFNIDWPNVAYSELWKPLYSGLAARLQISSYYSAASIPQDVQSQAQYWAQFYTSNSWSSQSDAIQLYKDASNRTATRCSSPKADVIFVLDSSGSITPSVFVNVRQFVVDVIRSFVIGSDNVRVSVTQFSDVGTVEFNLTAYDTTEQLVNATYGIPYYARGTNTPTGLRVLESVVLSQARYEDGVPVVAILMTDGQSNDKTATLNEAKRIHQVLDDKLVIYSMGVGSGIDTTELEAIASSPSCQYVYLLTSFNDITAFSYQIMKSACKVPAQITEDRPVSGSVEKGASYHFKASGKKEKRGFEITIKTPVGSRVQLYVSWTIQNPNSALHDYSILVGSSAINGGASLLVPWPADNNVNRRRRRDVIVNYQTTESVVDDQVLTLYGAIAGVGDGQGGNSFELSYATSDRLPSAAPVTAACSTFLMSVLAILLLLLQ